MNKNIQFVLYTVLCMLLNTQGSHAHTINDDAMLMMSQLKISCASVLFWNSETAPQMFQNVFAFHIKFFIGWFRTFVAITLEMLYSTISLPATRRKPNQFCSLHQNMYWEGFESFTSALLLWLHERFAESVGWKVSIFYYVPKISTLLLHFFHKSFCYFVHSDRYTLC